jgi:Ser/Thr protein kinase RdoA (MazF antagonist)
MLTVDNAIAFLLEHHLIDREWIIGGALMVQSAARRHRNLRVEGPDGAGHLIKQADGLAHGDHQTLGNEAAFLEYCHNEPSLAEVAQMVPRVVYRDRERSLHAQELIAGASSLFTLHHTSTPERLPIGPSRTLGQCLGTIHRLFGTRQPGADPRLAWLSRDPPTALRPNRATPAGLATLTPGIAAVLRILEDEALGDRVAALGPEWCPETVIHGDLKFDNVLVRSHPGPQDEDALELFLVDWEFVQFGDPAWDLAGTLHDYLMLWTSSMPIGPNLRSEEMIDQAQYPLPTLHEAMRAFWEAYQTARGLGPESSDVLIRRAVAFTAARLVQAAFERSLFEETLPAQAVILLQVSANVLADRELARLHLFGIPRRKTLW